MMNMYNFPTARENIKRNIAEVKSIISAPNVLDSLESRVFDRGIYLFQSIAKSMIGIGNNIIIENSFRTPLNTADVFISLAEHNIISPSVIPGMKKAAITMTRLKSYQRTELVDVMTGCIDDFSRCLSSYQSYFQKRETGGQ
jgi:hypothetical protein